MMETIIEYQIEPRVQVPPPRRATLGIKTNLLLAIAMLLFAVCLAGGLRTLLEAGRLGWVLAAGRTVPARIDGITISPLSEGGEQSQTTSIHYHYLSPFRAGNSISDGTSRFNAASPRDSVSLAGRRPLPLQTIYHIGDKLPVRCVLWRGKTVAVLWTPQAAQHITVLVLCGGLITAVSILLMRRLLAWSRARLFLLRHGIASVGTIVDKKTQSDDTVRYYVRYGFSQQSGTDIPAAREHEEQVTAEQWKQLEVGQPVTVLYDPVNAGRAGLYALIQTGAR